MGPPAWWHTVIKAVDVVTVFWRGLAWDEMSIGPAMCVRRRYC